MNVEGDRNWVHLKGTKTGATIDQPEDKKVLKRNDVCVTANSIGDGCVL